MLIGDGLITTLQTEWTAIVRQFNGDSTTLPVLRVDMDFEMVNQILEQRQEALENGVFIGTDGDFVPADIALNGEAVRVRMRLQQGPTRHLGADAKWNYEIRTDEDQPLLGMTRAQLIDPADNGWLNEWGYQQALREAGVLSTPYTFVNLVFNGDNRGIYALQGGFDANLPTSQGREPGIIVEFDPALIWQNIAYFEGDSQAALADPVTNLNRNAIQFLEVDTFRDAAVARDEQLTAQKEEAIEKLRAFQRGEINAEAIFDLELYGRFLAISDLWGAADALSLLNLRFYYNAQNGRLEPIGFNGNPQLDQRRVDLAAATFNDPALQEAAIQALQEAADPEFLTSLETNLTPEWSTWQNVLASEADISPPWAELAQQQVNLQRSLQPQQPVFANYVAAENTPAGVLQLEISNVVNLPVEIVGLDFGDALFLETQSDWVIDGEENLLRSPDAPVVLKSFADDLSFIQLEIPLTTIYANSPDSLAAADMQLAVRIWGTEQTNLTPVRPGFATDSR